MSKKQHKRKLSRSHAPKNFQPRNQAIQMQTTVIKLNDVRIGGFAGANAKAGEAAPVLVRAIMTSDEREFHQYMEGIGNVINHQASKIGISISLDSLVGFVLVVHHDASADLYTNNLSMIVEILAKRPIGAGEVVYGKDIADIRKVQYPGVPLALKDKVFICFKVGWKFGMLFDLMDDRDLDIDRMENDLGTLYRRLRYQALYEALADASTVERMMKAGWFPFIEIMGGEFEPLLKAHQSNFDIEDKEKSLVANFDSSRLDIIADRWWKNPIIAKHKIVLESGLEAFKRSDYVSCIKNIMTEIEGVLADIHLAEKGHSVKTKELLQHAVDKGVKKSGNESSLFLPNEFLEYLLKIAYADFDPGTPGGAGASRHTVGHGYASGDTYTAARALQVILTLDQVAFYL